MKNNLYHNQVQLLVKALPIVMEEEIFALKGGTAINLFIRNMPRLSVDIDLSFLPVLERAQSVSIMNDSMTKIADKLRKRISNIQVNTVYTKDGICRTLEIRALESFIKVDINHVLRGEVRPNVLLPLCDRAQEEFSAFLEIKCLHFDDIYAGKICAALSRQHPRDLFDIKILLDNEGISDNLRKVFIVYLASGNTPMANMIRPIFKNISHEFRTEFLGMNLIEVSCEELELARRRLVDYLALNLTNDEKQFLLSLKSGEPEWELLGLPNIQALPAIQWKLKNIKSMETSKRIQAYEKLKSQLM